ncbi:MAG: DNA mismatch repair endonuclease MutL [Polyangiaceae bacterium]|nr:DNA mismatch repair endonuclease MutL [Polyangiaceae bacterium]
MRRVQVLPDDLANQIAAGEVVERPASVVKELCENAIDAEATRVDVAIEGGGVAACSVADDGHGMSEDDLRLSITRHATSKIASLEDLLAIGTFGFRGEALPSIASVSRFRIASRLRAADAGASVSIDGGGAPSIEPVGMPPGTRVEIRDLFYNVPARRKFLRALATESAHVTEVVDGIALSRPDVTVTLERDGRRVREHLRAASREERVRSILVGWELVRCAGKMGPLEVEAHLSRPEKARMGATGLWVFVNGRPVRDRALSRSVDHAYGSVLEPGRYPVGVVYLDLPNDLVDVNVHPQKSEVRFAEPRAVQDAVHRVLSSALGSVFTSQLGLGAPSPARAASLPFDTGSRGPSHVAEQPEAVFTGSGELDFSGAMQLTSGIPSTAGAIPYPLREDRGAPMLSTTDGQTVPTSIRFIAQVRGMYLLCETDDAIIVLDQHAAAERVTFDRLRTAFHAKAVAMQTLLVPEIVDVRAADIAAVEAAGDVVQAMGMDIRVAGPTRLAIHAVPQLLVRADPRALATSLLGELARSGGRDYSGAIDLSLATMACHGSIRAGERVGPEQARELLERLKEIEFAGHCPHGRPILMRLPFRDLDHRVGRR